MQLKFIVIQLLKEKPYSGYDLMKAIHENSGWKPSPGSMYPVLDNLSKMKLVAVKISGKKKMYSLTEKGRKEAKEISSTTGKMVEDITKNIRLFSKLYVHDDVNYNESLLMAFEDLKKGKMPFGKLTKDAMELKKTLMNIYARGKYKNNEEKIRKILKRAVLDLKRI